MTATTPASPPAINAEASPPRGRRALRDAVIATLAVLLATVAVKWLQRPPYNLGLKMALGVLCGVGIFGMVIAGRRPARYGLRLPPNLRGAQVLTLLALFIGVVLAYGASQAVQRIDTGYFLTPQPELHLGLLAFFFGQHVIYSAVPEELLFRCYLQTQVRAATGGGLGSRNRRMLAIVIVALIFFANHVIALKMADISDYRSLLGVGILGLLLGWMRERTGSILGPLACHASFNATLAWIQVSHL